MNVAVREPRTETAERLMVVDCDIHPNPRSLDDVKQFLPQRWQRHMTTFGNLSREMYSDTIGYPRMAPAISRADAWPPSGGPPGSDLEFMRRQHLDPNGVEIGNLIPLATRGPDQRNLDYAAALCTALNDWQVADWLDEEPRLRGSHRRAARGPAGRRRRDRRAGRTIHASCRSCCRRVPPSRSAAALPADLRRGRRRRTPGGGPLRRPGRPLRHRHRLALLLHRGASLQRAQHAVAR